MQTVLDGLKKTTEEFNSSLKADELSDKQTNNAAQSHTSNGLDQENADEDDEALRKMKKILAKLKMAHDTE